MRANLLGSICDLTGWPLVAILAIALAGCSASSAGHRSLKDETSSKPSTHSVVRLASTRLASPTYANSPSSPASASAVCGADGGCLARLKALLADDGRKWIGKPQTLSEHVDGTRQFAYRALREQLSCHELSLAIADIATATNAMRASTSVPPEQITYVKKLDAQIQAELRNERGRRCDS